MAVLNPADIPNTTAIRTKQRHPRKTATRPSKTTSAAMLPPHDPRLEAKTNAVICAVRIMVHRLNVPQNLPLRTGCPRAMVAAAKETVMVIKRTAPARMELPIVEPD
jgi:hypothetical protein